jgi:hypothetical protein
MILESHIFVTKKRTGELKARQVAGGNKQRDFISKEESSSPTASNDSIILSSLLDAIKGREVVTVDIPNAFIQTVVEDEKDCVNIRIRGHLVNVLMRIAPKVYSDYVTCNARREKQILLQCLNALYGTMVASLLYYHKFTNSLKKHGFTMNPYDSCVWNKMVKNKQLTICFHVDDCKLSHASSQVQEETISWLWHDYESVFEDGSGKMKVHHGKVHKVLGTTLDFTSKSKVHISMIEYIREIILAWDDVTSSALSDGFKLVLRKRKTTLAAPDDLFIVNEDAPKLSSSQAAAFHNIGMKTLYATKHVQPDTSTAIAFLTTCVRSPDIDDWRKL